jgi:DNA adenine methylase
MSYPGGKHGSGVYQTIINLIPPHRTYVEGFLGGGAVMKLKKPAPGGNYGIDVDRNALESFQIDNLKPIFYHGDFMKLVNNGRLLCLNNPDTFLYLDPPYLISTRRTRARIYTHEFSDSDHVCLLKLIRTLKCMVMISGYKSKMYLDMLNGWRLVRFQAMTRGGIKATECLWMNYPSPKALHDYQYVGVDYRERERIKRKRQRWINRLRVMPVVERSALLEALKEL